MGRRPVRTWQSYENSSDCAGCAVRRTSASKTGHSLGSLTVAIKRRELLAPRCASVTSVHAWGGLLSPGHHESDTKYCAPSSRSKSGGERAGGARPLAIHIIRRGENGCLREAHPDQ